MNMNMIQIHCYKCGQTKYEDHFSPQQRIGDGKPHLCWECENKINLTRNTEDSLQIKEKEYEI
ncbi:hypothetical protein D4R42_00205 [bacterium]|nr:MAG: hypothetical protein D4R42_00205 [bacterium]